MQFSSLVLMERDKETNQFIREIESYEVSQGAEFVTKLYYDGEVINLYFDTNKDVEEWEFTAIYDVFDEEIFTTKGYAIEAIDEEYNPTWLVKFPFSDEHIVVKETINELCELIKDEFSRVFKVIKEKEEEYK